MAIEPTNRALRKLLAWLSESDLDVLVWSSQAGVPTLISQVDRSAEPTHAATLQLTETEEGER